MRAQNYDDGTTNQPKEKNPPSYALGFGKTAKYVVLAVTFISISVGVIGRYKPTLFYYIPRYGFVFYMLGTGGKSPELFVYDAWTPNENFQKWIKPKDLVVATGEKMGTNWMLYCTHQIRLHKYLNISDDPLWEDVNYATPWPSVRQNPGMSWSDEWELYNTEILPNGKPYRYYWDNPLYPFRIFKSHEYPVDQGGYLHVDENPNIKFLAMVRNPIDTSLSYLEFFKQLSQRSKDFKGGFPPALPESGNITKDLDVLLDMLHNKMRKSTDKQMSSRSMFSYIKGWWPHRYDSNVFLLHYKDATKDLSDTVSKLASFLEITLTTEQHEEITKRCGFDHMKDLASKGRFAYRLPLNRRFGEFRVMKVIEDEDGNQQHGSVVHKGGSRGKEMLNQRQQKFVHDVEEEELGYDPKLIYWARHGGIF